MVRYAGSIQELQHDLCGKPAVPSSFALAVKTPVKGGALVSAEQHDWLVGSPGDILPYGRISVRVIPYGDR